MKVGIHQTLRLCKQETFGVPEYIARVGPYEVVLCKAGMDAVMDCDLSDTPYIDATISDVPLADSRYISIVIPDNEGDYHDLESDFCLVDGEVIWHESPIAMNIYGSGGDALSLSGMLICTETIDALFEWGFQPGDSVYILLEQVNDEENNE